MATIWTSGVAQTIYIRQVGSVQSGPIAGVMSCTSSDVDDYDNENYRDEYAEALAVGAFSVVALTPMTKTTEAGVNTTGAAYGATASSFDDRVSHTPPKPEAKKRTIFLFWSGATGTGNVLAASWADEFMGCSLAEFEFI